MKKIILWSFISFSILSYSEAFALVSVSGNATYSGSKTGTIYVMAYMGSGCGDLGVPGYAVIDNPGPYTMNIPTGTFYICAYRDVNGNGMQDFDEPWGSYINNPINLPTDGATINGINLTLYDTLSVTKTVNFFPGGDESPIGISNSGDEIQYTINYNFTVPVDDTIVRIIDDFDSNLTLVTREHDSNFSHTLFDSVTNILTWQNSSPSNFNAGTYSGTVTFRATINNGLNAGVEINNQVCLSMELPAGAGSNPQDVCDVLTFTIGEPLINKPQPIPTLSEWGMIIFSLLLAGSAIWMMRRRQVS
jgi:fimbrial isopeptide formation D2 family protein